MQSQASLGGSSPQTTTHARLPAIVMAVGLFLVLLAPMAFADCALTDPACTTDQATNTVTDTAGGAGDTVDGTVTPVKDKADEAVKQVTDTVNGILHPGGTPTPTPTPTGGGGGGSGGSGANGRRAAGSSSGVGAVNRETIPGASITTAPPTRPVAEKTAHGPSLAGRIGEAAAEAVKQVAFPLALALIVVAFLLLQNRLDRRDPKLASAPITPDVLRFA
jgi:hypothetical protein